MKASRRRNLIIFALVAATLILLWISWAGGLVPQVVILNQALKQDPVLAEYPYQFRAVLLASGVATVTRPYDERTPPWRFLATVEPELADKEPGDRAFIPAMRRFKEQERRAIQVVLAHPEATAIEWTLDRAWYHRNEIALDP